MKRLMVGLAAVMMTSAAWTQAPAQEAAKAAPGRVQCTVGVTSFKTGHTQVVSAKLMTADACRAWALDTTHLDSDSGQYELFVHDAGGKVVLHQACTVHGVVLFGSKTAKFDCKDVAA